jgi:hypothetical protein
MALGGRLGSLAPATFAAALLVLAPACSPADGSPDAAAEGSPPPSRPATYAGPVLDLPDEEPDGDEGLTPATGIPTGAGTDEAGAASAHLPHETERDWAIARGTVEWGLNQGLDALPTGEVMALVASTFVGTRYEPGTLELPGPERLVVNLRTFDCVTLVEHALVLARLITRGAEAVLADDETFRGAFRDRLTAIRYRGGEIDGYPSRLHYFTEWLDHGIAAGELEEVTDELGGILDERPIHFMSSNPDAYRQLAEDPELLEPIRGVEAELSARTRLYVPQERIAEVEDGIRNGDIIAAVSTLDGLDIAHTGLALRHGGRIHLLHAPLVGDSVEVSVRPLAERIQGISAQKGIRVVRAR